MKFMSKNYSFLFLPVVNLSKTEEYRVRNFLAGKNVRLLDLDSSFLFLSIQ